MGHGYHPSRRCPPTVLSMESDTQPEVAAGPDLDVTWPRARGTVLAGLGVGLGQSRRCGRRTWPDLIMSSGPPSAPVALSAVDLGPRLGPPPYCPSIDRPRNHTDEGPRLTCGAPD